MTPKFNTLFEDLLKKATPEKIVTRNSQSKDYEKGGKAGVETKNDTKPEAKKDVKDSAAKVGSAKAGGKSGVETKNDTKPEAVKKVKDAADSKLGSNATFEKFKKAMGSK